MSILCSAHEIKLLNYAKRAKRAKMRLQAFLVFVVLLTDCAQSLHPKPLKSLGGYSYTKQEGETEYLSPDVQDQQEKVSDNFVIHQESRRQKITDEDIENAMKECLDDIPEIRKKEKKLADQGRVVNKKSADSSQNRAHKWDPKNHQFENVQLPLDMATGKLYKKFSLSRSEVNNDLPRRRLNGANGRRVTNECEEEVNPNQCETNARYRTADGTCNNERNPAWGRALTCFRRLLGASYEGQAGFRQSVRGGPLPGARSLSLNVHAHMNRQTSYVNHLYMFFGQLLDHDITFTPQSVTADNEAIQCCPREDDPHPQCEPIDISSNDPFYSRYNIRCLNFVRSSICPYCTLGPRMQINQVTSYIDCSFVYGNSLNETAELRANDGTGMLTSQTTSSGQLLPASPDPANDQCSVPEENQVCFLAGDARANQSPPLTSLHTLFHREHNRLVVELSRINPQWGEERLFQEGRRILVALMEVIVYKEYLPITLGSERMSFFRLWINNRSGGTTDYDPDMDPTMYTDFATAAFRFGHSLINTVMARNWPNGESRMLRDAFFQPFDLYDGEMDPLMRDLTRSSAQQFDRHVVPDVTNFLYRVPGNQTGLDLPAFNIQRGRDHGMPPYTEMVYFCSGEEINVRSFDDLVRYELMTSETADILRRNYRDVRDIDLWTGIVSEIYNNNAVVGPTATCIIGMQFRNVKYGDRYYFEHRNQPGSFTRGQLDELKKVRLSHIVCLNTNVSQMPNNAMLFSSRNNPLIDCSRVTGIDLSCWKTST